MFMTSSRIIQVQPAIMKFIIFELVAEVAAAPLVATMPAALEAFFVALEVASAFT